MYPESFLSPGREERRSQAGSFYGEPPLQTGLLLQVISCSLHVSQELQCDVSVEEDNRQEWTFTLYDFDNNGRVTREVSKVQLPLCVQRLLTREVFYNRNIFSSMKQKCPANLNSSFHGPFPPRNNPTSSLLFSDVLYHFLSWLLFNIWDQPLKNSTGICGGKISETTE